ncbi:MULTISPECIES: phage late control D family protein [Pontibacillus]|uniref:Late control protein n=1 Tax=Pontibacillus chungwhensis TaxID=265426 RepID=A0ABY8V2C0_9BACI|nr:MULTISPECIES: late control protein [Pontibacillus]MCD5324781.1 late control protein [Pontibacillus sp. HN14]WIF98740.1 late control protein [Pontibacillus chungwhensis]
MKARRAKVIIEYQGVDITTDLAPYLLSFVYSDNEGRADDIQITLQDREAKWHGPWLPGKGDIIKASIEVEAWDKENDNRKLNCGVFYVDAVDFSGPPDTVKIKALSVPIAPGGKNSKRSRTWEGATLSKIASDIADQAELTLLFDAKDVTYDRVDQVERTGLSFLSNLARKEGAATKVNSEQLIVYDEQKYESKAPIREIVKGESKVLGYSFSISTAENEYKECTVSYFDEDQKKTLIYTYVVPGVDEGPTLTVNQRVKSLAEAKRLARKSVRNKNKYERTGKLKMMGSPEFVQGLTIITNGWGKYDDKYFIESSVHRVNNGYTTDLNIRKALNY